MLITFEYKGLEFRADVEYTEGYEGNYIGLPENRYPGEDPSIEFNILSLGGLNVLDAFGNFHEWDGIEYAAMDAAKKQKADDELESRISAIEYKSAA